VWSGFENCLLKGFIQDNRCTVQATNQDNFELVLLDLKLIDHANGHLAQFTPCRVGIHRKALQARNEQPE